MDDWESVPESILIDFLTSKGTLVRLSDLGQSFLLSLGLDIATTSDRPFQIEAIKKKSSAGNPYYEFTQNKVPFPDGLDTFIRVNGIVIPMGKVKKSEKGNPTREGNAIIVVGTVQYEVTTYLTEGRIPYYVKVNAHKKRSQSSGGRPRANSPRGGRIV